MAMNEMAIVRQWHGNHMAKKCYSSLFTLQLRLSKGWSYNLDFTLSKLINNMVMT